MSIMDGLPEHYPGSKELRKVNTFPVDPEAPLDLGKPWILEVKGYDVEFYPIGSLAAALNRKPGTIRALEREGVLPPSGWWKPSGDRRGRRRIWTRAQIEGTVRIAREEGVLEPGPRVSITATRFTEHVTALFAQLRKEGVR